MKWENWENEREGEERRKAGRSSLRARLFRVCPTGLREEGGRVQLSCKLRELLVPIEVAIVTLSDGHTGKL